MKEMFRCQIILNPTDGQLICIKIGTDTAQTVAMATAWTKQGGGKHNWLAPLIKVIITTTGKLRLFVLKTPGAGAGTEQCNSPRQQGRNQKRAKTKEENNKKKTTYTKR